MKKKIAKHILGIEERLIVWVVTAIVKRVVEARKQHAAGLRPEFPSLIAPAQPHAPAESQGSAPAPVIAGESEKERYSQSEPPATNKPAKQKKQGFFSSLKCWG